MMDEEKKELKEGKESMEKDLEKSINEQKEILKVPQSDIRDIKESLQEIRGILEETSKVSLLYVLGGVYIAIGLAMMGFSVSSSSLKILGVLVGLFIFLAGVFIIIGTYYARTNVNKYPDLCINALKELKHTNKWLFCSFLCIVCAILTFIVLFCFSFGL